MSDLGNKITTPVGNWDGNDNNNNLWWQEGQYPSTVNDGARKLQGAVRRDWERRGPYLTSTGSTNAYVLTYGQVPDGLYRGDVYSFVANFTNTGAATVNINSLGAKAIKYLGGDLTAGMIAVNGVATIGYNGTNFELLSAPHSVVYTGGSGGSFDSATLTNVNITSGTISGLTTPLPVASGGTGGATAAAAKTNLGFLTPSDIGATVQGYDVKTPKLNTANYWEKAQLAGGANWSPTISGSFTIDANTHPNCLYLQIVGDVTLATPTNFNGAGTLTLLCLNNGGARNLAFGAGWYKLNTSNNWDTTNGRWNIISVAWVGNATFFYNITQYA